MTIDLWQRTTNPEGVSEPLIYVIPSGFEILTRFLDF